MWRDDAYLLDIVVAAKWALRFVKGMTWKEFDASPLHQDAVVDRLVIISNAAKKVSREMKEAHPEIPWREIVEVSNNRLIFDYFRVDIEAVWRTIQDDLPGIVQALEPLVPPEKKS